MKRTVLILATAVLFAACSTSGEEKKVNEISQTFLDSYIGLEIDKAKELCNENIMATLKKQGETIKRLDSASVRKLQERLVNNISAVISETEIHNDTASVRYSILNGTDTLSTGNTIKLEKTDGGEWVVFEIAK